MGDRNGASVDRARRACRLLACLACLAPLAIRAGPPPTTSRPSQPAVLSLPAPPPSPAAGPGPAAAPRPGAAAPAGGAAGPAPLRYRPGEVLVRFRDRTPAAEKGRLREQAAPRVARTFRSGAEHWVLPPGLSTEEAIRRFRGHPHLEYIEPNYLLFLAASPDDPLYPQQWALRNTGQTGGLPGADIGAETAWDHGTGERRVLVAVIDTGADPLHPDLAANLWANPGEVPGNGVDDDGNGYVDDARGWDWVHGDGEPSDDNGHGTHVAGILGAAGGDGVGVTGVAWRVTIVPLKVFDEAGRGSVAEAASAVEYAAALGVDVINNSWGGDEVSRALLDALLEAARAGAVVVCAAGNSGRNNDLTPFYPAGYDVPGLIAVAATDHNDLRAGFSNYGAASVDLGAPGVDVLGAAPGGGHRFLSGTSMAAPHVSGAAALVRALAAETGPESVRGLLLGAAHPLPSLQGLAVSGGRLALGSLLAARDTTPPAAIADLEILEAASNSLLVAWTAPGDDGDEGRAAAYDILVTPAGGGAAFRAADPPAPEPAGTRQTAVVAGLQADTEYGLTIRARDEWGNAGPDSPAVTGRTLPPPTLRSSPAAIEAEVLTNERTTRGLLIENVGQGTLDWTLDLPILAAPGDAFPPPSTTYRALDSDMPGGPAFVWEDLGTTGTLIKSLNSENQISEALPLGFRFPFYGGVFESVRVTTNGFLTFTGVSSPSANKTLPSAEAPPDLVAPFWDHLHFLGVQRARFLADGTVFTVQYTAVPTTESSSHATFQVSLYPSGEIVFRYLEMLGETRGATVGIQDGTRTDGLLIAHNANYLRDRLAVRIFRARQWLTGSPTQGRLGPGEGREVTLAIDATDLDGGRHEAAAVLRANDPAAPLTLHPVTLSVTPIAGIALEPEAVSFGTVFAGYAYTQSLAIRNPGTAPLSVEAVRPGDPTVYAAPESLTVPARSTRNVALTWAPPEPGTLEAVLEVASDAHGMPLASAALSGTAVPPPIIEATPQALTASLYTGATAAATLRIANLGGSSLVAAPVAETGTTAGWLRVAAGSRTIPPGAYEDFAVTLDAGTHGTTVLEGSLRIDSNIPAPPPRVPVTLSVTGAPHLAIGGRDLTLVSAANVTVAGAQTVHPFPIVMAPQSAGGVEVSVNGNFERPEEIAEVFVEGAPVGTLGSTGFVCFPASKGFSVAAAEFGGQAADGTITVAVRNAPAVDAFCATNSHSVRLTYTLAWDRIDFGTAYAGTARRLSLEIANRGPETLLIGSIASDRPEFTASAAAMELGAWRSANLQVTFQPPAAGSYTGRLTLRSNDPDRPAATVTLTGAALERPVARVQPTSLAVLLREGESVSKSLTLSNLGVSTLNYTVSASDPEGGWPAYLGVAPTSGSIAPGKSAALTAALDAAGLPPGDYGAVMVIASNDPTTPRLEVPIALGVRLVCADADGDLWAVCDPSCLPPPGVQCGECDDADPLLNPGAAEICDGRDQDCNGLIDDGPAGGDPDADGLGSACDNCPLIWNAGQADADADGTGDVCERDALCARANLDASGFSATRIDGRDLEVFARAFGTCPGDPDSDARANLDLAPEGIEACVGPLDFHLFMTVFATRCGGTP